MNVLDQLLAKTSIKTEKFTSLEDAPDDILGNYLVEEMGPSCYEEAPLDAEGSYHIDQYLDAQLYGVKVPLALPSVASANSEKPDDSEIAQEIAASLVSRFEFRNDATGLYWFNPRLGVYELLQKNGDFHGSIAYFVTNNSELYQHKLKSSIFNMIYSWLRNNRRWSRPMPKVDESKVCLRNGVYDVLSGDFVEHDKKFGFKSFVNCHYESNARLSQLSKSYFIQLGGSESGAKMILAVLGLIISNYRKLGKAVFLYGPRNNGKSTFSDLIREILPDKAVKGLSITDFGNQYAIANLKDAHVTICTDLPTGNWSRTAIGRFKQTVTGDFFEAGAKGVQHETIKPHAFVMFVSNFLPQIPKSQDPEGAVQRRIWPILTGKAVAPDQVDPDIKEKLLDDIDAIISVALHEVHHLLIDPNLATITSANDEIYVEEPVTIEDCLNDFLTNVLEFTGAETETIPLSHLFELFVNRYKSSCSSIATMRINGYGVHLRKAIHNTGGTVKKMNNISTLIGFRLKETHYKK